MTEAELRNRIFVFSDGSSEPKITSEDLDMLVMGSKTMDKYGVWPTEDSWTATYDVNWAIGTAWELKAARTANRYLFMSGGKMFSRNQYYDHCVKMSRYYKSKGKMLAERLAPDNRLLEQIQVVGNI